MRTPFWGPKSGPQMQMTKVSHFLAKLLVIFGSGKWTPKWGPLFGLKMIIVKRPLAGDGLLAMVQLCIEGCW